MSAADGLRAGLEDRMAPELLSQLRAVPLDPARPLLVLDADEVLVDFAGHLGRFAAGRGVRMELSRYQLQGSFRDARTRRVLDFDEVIGLIDRFFEAETLRQTALAGAVEAVSRLSQVAQVVVLTNVPAHAAADRRRNLAGLGIEAPMVQNAGGKGRALAWLMAGAGAPAAFVDDSPNQIESAKRRAPGLFCLHFAGSPEVAHVMPACAEADRTATSWEEAEAILAGHFG